MSASEPGAIDFLDSVAPATSSVATAKGAKCAVTQARKFDLVLVVEYFRTSTFLLPIIKYLGSKYRVGLYQVTIDDRQLAKQRAAQDRFVRLCVDYGAQLIETKPVNTRILLIPQRPYLAEALRDIRDNIRSERILGALSFAWAGQPAHDAFLQECGVEKAFAIDRRFIEFLLEKRGNRAPYEGLEIAEVGLPYRRHPIFLDFSTDYLLAIPTPFSFPHERDKWQFLEAVLALFGEIDEQDLVVHKPHNGIDYDQFSSIRYRRAARRFLWIPGAAKIARFLGNHASRAMRRHFGKLYTAHLYERVLRRTVTLAELTEHHDMALEAFLPGVRKGVIGGLSNTIWGTLHAGLPYYNCVNIESQRPEGEDKLYGKKRAERALGINLEFFLVPFCQGKLQFDTKYFNIVADTSRQGDLISELEKELARVPKSGHGSA